MGYILQKLRSREVREKIFLERFPEPLHVNLASLLVAAFGSFRTKVRWDLVPRPHNAYAILKAADRARGLGLSAVTVIEFGVAAGAGLMNMAHIAGRVHAETGVEVRVVGFDTGQGMPPARDYRDHPDLYQQGDYPMDFERLSRALPPHASLRLGDTAANIAQFLSAVTHDCPIGYIVVDVDYYWSTQVVLEALKDADPRKYLPLVSVFLDDVWLESNNSFCGELLAVREFNEQVKLRKIEHNPFLEYRRLFRRAMWLRQLHTLHVLDYPTKFDPSHRTAPRHHDNPYLS